MGNGIWRTIGAVELIKSVQLNGATKDVAVKGHRFASSTRKVDVRRQQCHTQQP